MAEPNAKAKRVIAITDLQPVPSIPAEGLSECARAGTGLAAMGQDRACAESAVSEWNGLFRVGGLDALVLVVYSLATMVQLLVLGGPPATAAEVFSLLQNRRIVGLLRLDLPTIIVLPLYYLLFLGLFAALRQTDRARALFGHVASLRGSDTWCSPPPQPFP